MEGINFACRKNIVKLSKEFRICVEESQALLLISLRIILQSDIISLFIGNVTDNVSNRQKLQIFM